MSTLLAIFGGSGWLAFGLIALRLSGIKRDRDKADIARAEQTKELRTLETSYKQLQARTDKMLGDLKDEIKQLETELEGCNTPGSRRDAINRLLQETDS